MKILQNESTLLYELNGLRVELENSRDAYFKLENAKEYPDLQQFFRSQYEQRLDFSNVIRHELTVLGQQHTLRGNRNPDRYSYSNFAELVAKRNMPVQELDMRIIENESHLAQRYQDLLGYKNLPKALDAILQSQAEQINVKLEKLRLDFETIY